MTLKELELIKAVLENYLNSDSCVDNMETDDTQLAIATIDREIKLKTMDPRKDK